MVPSLKDILAQVIADRQQGIIKRGKHYLYMFPEPTSSDERTRYLGRVYKAFHENKDAIEEATAAKEPTPIKRIQMHKRDDISIDEYFNYAKEGQRIENSINGISYQTNFEYDRAICILFSSDHHIGSSGADYDSMMEDFKYLLQNDVKLILNGDMMENKKEFPRNLFSVLRQVLSPEMQEDFVTKLLHHLKPNILAYVSGNHEVNARHGEQNAMKRCCDSAGIEFFEGGCLLEMDIQGAEYRIFTRHRPLSMSKVSPLLGVRKMEKMERADIYSAGHVHVPGIGVDWPLGYKRICIITGTYNDRAAYSRIGYGEHSAQQVFPCVVLLPKYKDMIAFSDVRNAVVFRDSINRIMGYE